MKVYLYQNDKEPFFWTSSEIESLNIDAEFTLNDVQFTIIKDVEYNTGTQFYDDGLNVLILNYTRSFELFKSIFDLNKNKKYAASIASETTYDGPLSRFPNSQLSKGTTGPAKLIGNLEKDAPLSKEEANRILYERDRADNQRSAALAFKHAQDAEKARQANSSFWGDLKRITGF